MISKRTTAPAKPSTFITLREVMELLRVTRPTLEAWVKKGEFPPPFRLGGKSLRWRRMVVNAWLEQQEAADANF